MRKFPTFTPKSSLEGDPGSISLQMSKVFLCKKYNCFNVKACSECVLQSTYPCTDEEAAIIYKQMLKELTND